MNLTEQVFKMQMGPRSVLLININQTFHIYYQNFDVCGMRIRLCLSMLYWHLYSWQKHGDALQQVVWSPLQQHLLPQKRISLAQKGIDRKSQNLKQIWCEFMGKDDAKEVGRVEVVHAPIKTIVRMLEKLHPLIAAPQWAGRIFQQLWSIGKIAMKCVKESQKSLLLVHQKLD